MKGKMTIEKISDIDLAAAEWVTRRRAGLSELQEAAYQQWLAASSRHLGAYARALAASAYIDEAFAQAHNRDPVSRRPTASPLERPDRRWFIAAGAATLLIAGGMTDWLLRGDRGYAYRTEIGEMRSLLLSDGSRMELNTDSQAIVRFGRTQREIELVRGETVFEVVKDVRRPFIVDIGYLTVRALGTTFSVRRREDEIEVLVTEGSVEAARVGDSNSAAPKVIAAHERLIARREGSNRIELVSQEAAERALAWRSGRLSFNGERLRDAIAEINRYNGLQIVVDDNQLGERPIVGSFPVRDVAGFVAAVSCSFGARVERQGTLIRLVPGSTFATENACKG